MHLVREGTGPAVREEAWALPLGFAYRLSVLLRARPESGKSTKQRDMQT